MVIDQLRILRNTLCHSFKAEINRKEFKTYIELAKEAFEAVHLSTERLDAIVSFSPSDFPIEKSLKLEEYFKNEFRETQLRRTEGKLFEDDVKRHLEEILTYVKPSDLSKGKLK